MINDGHFFGEEWLMMVDVAMIMMLFWGENLIIVNKLLMMVNPNISVMQ